MIKHQLKWIQCLCVKSTVNFHELPLDNHISILADNQHQLNCVNRKQFKLWPKTITQSDLNYLMMMRIKKNYINLNQAKRKNHNY